MQQSGEDAPEGISEGDRTGPESLEEQLALEEAKSGQGERIMEGRINDPRYPEDKFGKFSHKHGDTEIHYWRDLSSGRNFGFKFK